MGMILQEPPNSIPLCTSLHPPPECLCTPQHAFIPAAHLCISQITPVPLPDLCTPSTLLYYLAYCCTSYTHTSAPFSIHRTLQHNSAPPHTSMHLLESSLSPVHLHTPSKHPHTHTDTHFCLPASSVFPNTSQHPPLPSTSMYSAAHLCMYQHH